MRDALSALSKHPPDHLALAYDSWAPLGTDGKLADTERQDWLSRITERELVEDYEDAFKVWKTSFGAPGDLHGELELQGRLLIGHGNSSATGMGITVHHTWGVPVIPGSALKGLVAHYIDAVYGPDDTAVATPPWEPTNGDRAAFQGLTWRGRRIQRGPGSTYRSIFGSPEAEEDDVARRHEYPAGASKGLVVFHDALYVPWSAGRAPFACDVLTVHQKEYYDTTGATWPNDYDEPNPVSFVTVQPRAKFLLALSGPPDWTRLVSKLLADALHDWGIGGKTSAGYGIGEVLKWTVPPPREKPPSDLLARFLADIEQIPRRPDGSKMTQAETLAFIERQWLITLQRLHEQERARAAHAIRGIINSPKQKVQQACAALVHRLNNTGQDQ